MSHDQKPARVRVVRNAAAPAQRRRGDAGVDAVVIDHDAGSPQGEPGTPDPAAVPAAFGVGVLGLATLLAAAALAGIGVTLVGLP